MGPGLACAAGGTGSSAGAGHGEDKPGLWLLVRNVRSPATPGPLLGRVQGQSQGEQQEHRQRSAWLSPPHVRTWKTEQEVQCRRVPRQVVLARGKARRSSRLLGLMIEC